MNNWPRLRLQVYSIIEALSDGAVKQGIPRALSYKMAAQTLLGASKMVLNTDEHPAILKDNVCSPGGTTICGIHALERGGLRYRECILLILPHNFNKIAKF